MWWFSFYNHPEDIYRLLSNQLWPCTSLIISAEPSFRIIQVVHFLRWCFWVFVLIAVEISVVPDPQSNGQVYFFVNCSLNGLGLENANVHHWSQDISNKFLLRNVRSWINMNVDSMIDQCYGKVCLYWGTMIMKFLFSSVFILDLDSTKRAFKVWWEQFLRYFSFPK